MMGKILGRLQFAARSRPACPPALKAIITVGFTDDRYNDDIHYKGGCLLNDNLWWGAIMLAYQVRPGRSRPAGEGLAGKLAPPPAEHAVSAGTVDAPSGSPDPHRRHGSVCEDWPAIQVPVLAFDGGPIPIPTRCCT